MCTYDALRAAWQLLAETVPREQWGVTQFFRVPDAAQPDSRLWRPLLSDDVATWGKQVGAAAGLDAETIFAQCFRLGGATDMYDLYGADAERYVRERGRWASDIAQIYMRVSASAHGAISRSLATSTGVDLQSLLSGWTQAAVTMRCPI